MIERGHPTLTNTFSCPEIAFSREQMISWRLLSEMLPLVPSPSVHQWDTSQATEACSPPGEVLKNCLVTHAQTQVLQGSLLLNQFASAQEGMIFYFPFTPDRKRSFGSRGPVLVTVLADGPTRVRLRQALHVCFLQARLSVLWFLCSLFIFFPLQPGNVGQGELCGF